MVSARKPILLPPSVVYIDATIYNTWYIWSTRVSQVGILTIGVTSGCGYDSTCVSTVVGIMMGAGWVEGYVG